MIEWIKAAYREWKAQRVRNIPDSYFKGHRRIAITREEIKGEKCWNCKHAVAYVTWWCDRIQAKKECKWESCYVASELTKADLNAGKKDVGGWLRLPPDEVKKPDPQTGT